MAGQGRRRRRRKASSDSDESGDEEDRLEKMLANHQQRNVSYWGQGEDSSGSNGHSRASNHRARRDERRDTQRKRRRDDDERDLDESFAVDTVGTGVAISTESTTLPTSVSSVSVQRVDGLLLPGHVDVQTEEERAAQDETKKEIVDERADEEAQGELGDFIQLDGDRPGPAARYYEAEEEENRKAFEECLTCGEMGHEKKSCPHLQCLACGALDEHSTRQCPMGMSCFRCGGQGHKALDCKKPRTQGPQGWKECQRCGSTSHVDPKCPTLWRLYFYHTAAEYDSQRREKYRKATPAVSRGADRGAGFDYRSESEEDEEEGAVTSQEKPPASWDPVVRWCYNCAAEGNHWGDDCPLPRCNPTRQSGDPSGFSEYMACSGPFAHSLPPPPAPDQHAYRSGLRRGRDDYDRFEAGPGASMHVYDPQREAMHSVDQLFDRYGPGANRRRDAIRRGRGGDLASRIAPQQPPPPRVDRRSGQGSKAQRYQEMERDRERDRWSSADYHRQDGRSSQVSANAYGPAYTSETPSDHSSAEESVDEDFEMTHVKLAAKKEQPRRKSGLSDKAAAKLERRAKSKMLADISRKEKLGLPISATKQQVRAAIKARKEKEKLAKQEQQERASASQKKARFADQVAKQEAKQAREKERLAQEEATKQAKKEAKLANREQMKVTFQEAQARRLAKGKVEEHDRKAKEFAAQEEKWLAGN